MERDRGRMVYRGEPSRLASSVEEHLTPIRQRGVGV
jgi:hypothetical protein